MSVNLIFRIPAIGIIVTVLTQILKHSGREEQAFLTSLAGLLLVLFWIVPYIYELFSNDEGSVCIIGGSMDILRIPMIGMTGVCLAIPLKSYKAEYGMLISLGTCVCIFIYLVTKLEIVVEYIGRIETVLNLDGGYIRLMLKMMGITYVAQFAAEICKDAGYGAVGSQIELFGKVSILFVSMPVLLALLQTVGDFL